MGRLGGIAPIRALRHKAERTPFHKIHLLVSALERTCSMEKGHCQHRFAKPLNRNPVSIQSTSRENSCFTNFAPVSRKQKNAMPVLLFAKRPVPNCFGTLHPYFRRTKSFFAKPFLCISIKNGTQTVLLCLNLQKSFKLC
jgi:hypothetical protein